jgi:hypothetical protein
LLVEIIKSPKFYLLEATNILKYDYSYNPGIFLKDKCDCCNQWYEVSQIFPIKIIDSDESNMTANTFYRTDLETGGQVMRLPIILVTENIPRIFKNNDIKDIYFEVAGKDWIRGNYKLNLFK